MSRIPVKLTAVAATSALAAAGAGAVLSADAASPHHAKTAHAAKAKNAKAKRRGPAKLLGRAVHADLTVPTKDGFKDVSIDRGFLKTAVGTQLTIDESTKKLTSGKLVGVSVPSDAKVVIDKKAAQLSDLKPGEHVAVFKLPKKTVVRAFTPKP